jgi:hypothetical protein
MVHKLTFTWEKVIPMKKMFCVLFGVLFLISIASASPLLQTKQLETAGDSQTSVVTVPNPSGEGVAVQTSTLSPNVYDLNYSTNVSKFIGMMNTTIAIMENYGSPIDFRFGAKTRGDLFFRDPAITIDGHAKAGKHVNITANVGMSGVFIPSDFPAYVAFYECAALVKDASAINANGDVALPFDNPTEGMTVSGKHSSCRYLGKAVIKGRDYVHYKAVIDWMPRGDGNYAIFAFIDPQFKVQETNEVNNLAAINTKVPYVNIAPVANAGTDHYCRVNQPCAFDGSGSYDKDGTIVEYKWLVDIDSYWKEGPSGPFGVHIKTPVIDFKFVYGKYANYTYDTAGDRSVRLTVKDDDGGTSIDDVIVHVVGDMPPVADPSKSAKKCYVNQPCQFDGTASTDDGTIVKYTWTVDSGGGEKPDPYLINSIGAGDGEVQLLSAGGGEGLEIAGRNPGPLPWAEYVYGPTPVYTYTKEGNRSVVLTVMDDANQTGSATFTVEVVKGGSGNDTTAPVITGVTEMNVTLGAAANVVWTISDDNPDSYTVYRDSIAVKYGKYSSGGFVAVLIDTSALKTFTYVIIANDAYGNYANMTTKVHVVEFVNDTTPPSITGIAEMNVTQGTAVNVSWAIADANPDSYSIALNGGAVKSSAYASGDTVALAIDTTAIRTLTYVIVANDTFGNIANMTTVVNIIHAVPDTFPPVILALSPSGTIAYTTAVTLGVVTDEIAACRLSATNTIYDSMITMATTDGITHTLPANTVVGRNVYYVLCRDVSNNTMTAPGVIDFTVSSSGGNGGGNGGGTSYYPYIMSGDSGSIHSKETVVETTVEVPVQPIISLQESKIYLLANGLTVSRDYYYDPATNQTRYTLKVKNNLNESVRLVIKDAVPKTFANTTKDFKVKPVPTTVYQDDPIIGWEVVLGPNQTFTVTYQFNKKLELAEVQALSAPEITVSSLDEGAAETTITPKPEVTVAPAGITGFVTGVFGNLALGIVVFVIVVFGVAYYWKGEYIKTGFRDLHFKLRLGKISTGIKSKFRGFRSRLGRKEEEKSEMSAAHRTSVLIDAIKNTEEE